MATQAQMSDHVSRVRQASAQILDAVAALDALRKEWDYANIGGALPNDLTALGHAELTSTDIANAYSTATALRGLLDAGHGTNLMKVKA